MKNKYFMILEEFEKYYPMLAEDAVDWYPSGRDEITVKLKNGSRVYYDHDQKAFGYVRTNIDSNYEEENWKKEFGRRLNKLMRSKGLIQSELAGLSEMSVISISNYIRGVSTPSGYNIIKLARALGCSVSELIDF